MVRNRLCRVIAAILLAAVLALAGCARTGQPEKPEEANRPEDAVRTVQMDSVRGFHMLLPAGGDFAQADLTTGREEELKTVESK